MRERHHVHTTLSNHEAVQFGDIVLLAVKPQNLERVFADIKGAMRPEQVLLSIVAGAGIERLREGTGHYRIVRCMPNTPAQIGAGVSVWMASSQVTQEDRTLVRSILGAVGLEIEVDKERYVDMATAVSGTGPRTFSCSSRLLWTPLYTLDFSATWRWSWCCRQWKARLSLPGPAR